MFCALTLALLCTPSPSPQEEPVDRVQRHPEFLASDELKGRGPGTLEIRVAADYIAAQFKGPGLQPFAEESYFQAFPLPDQDEPEVNVIGIVRARKAAQTSVETQRARRTRSGPDAMGGVGNHVVPEGRGRGQDAVVSDLVRARPGDQGAEPLEEGPGCEDDVRAAVGVEVAQAQEDAALFVE